jgi:hypothetical protein
MIERIPASWVRRLFAYDEQTGKLTWAVPSGRHGRIPIGTQAGSVHADQDGYKSRHVNIGGKQYTVSRLIWAWKTGEWPKQTIDHKNCDSLDDRWENLREANNAQKWNNRKRRDSATGYKCVVYYSDPRYRDGKCFRWQVRANGKTIKSSERYMTAKEAHEAYLIVLPKLHGDFANSGDS